MPIKLTFVEMEIDRMVYTTVVERQTLVQNVAYQEI